jgi:hypothetical protein
MAAHLVTILENAKVTPAAALTTFEAKYPDWGLLFDMVQYQRRAFHLQKEKKYRDTIPPMVYLEYPDNIGHADFYMNWEPQYNGQHNPNDLGALLHFLKKAPGPYVFATRQKPEYSHEHVRVWFYTLPKRKKILDSENKEAVDFVDKKLAQYRYDFGDLLQIVFDLDPGKDARGNEHDNKVILETLSGINTTTYAPGAVTMMVRIMNKVAEDPSRMELLKDLAGLGKTTYQNSINLVVLKHFLSKPDPTEEIVEANSIIYGWYSSNMRDTEEIARKELTRPFLEEVVAVLEKRVASAKAKSLKKTEK